MTAHLDRDKAEAVILEHFHAPDNRHSSWWIRPAEMADALEACVVPDPPQTIDRDDLMDLLARVRGTGGIGIPELADRILALTHQKEASA